MAPQNFSYTGAEQTYAVPPGITTLAVDAIGALGGAGDDRDISASGASGAAGALSADAKGEVAVTPREVLHVEAGQASNPDTSASGGFNAGLEAGGGGGLSHGPPGSTFAAATSAIPSVTITPRLAVASPVRASPLPAHADHRPGAANGTRCSTGSYASGEHRLPHTYSPSGA
jgi:hypothetical protein